ncbi:MAG: nitroreductase [Eubacterium sp.]|jgi:nitroreductase|nr:nitroreductase [Eubacterium sp.]
MESNFLELTKKRRSIRKYTDKPVPRELVEYFISCAAYAPSGCDSQCWHFVAVDNREIINRLADATAKEAIEFYGTGYSGATQEFLTSREKAVSFFRNAPLVIFVFMDKMKYYDERAVQVFSKKGYDYRGMVDKLGYYDILSIGAAVQNMLLAITEKGYGACWMNDPVIAEDKIKELLGVRNELKLISVVPVGEPQYSPRQKVLKDQKAILEYR